jgi:DNA-binding transcriptional ArsR family regulator
MEEKTAIKALAALAQEHRLKVFRLLVRHAPQGLPAGQVAAQVGVPASTMSTHLAQLERAGLLRSWRDQRRILYAVDTEGIRQLVTFLTEECCGGRPELCGYDPPAGGCQGPDSAACAPGTNMERPDA